LSTLKYNTVHRIYFDHAATTPISPEVIEAMTDALQKYYGNPSSIHAEGRSVRALIEEARKVISRGINASTAEIFFTSGGTESNNMAIKCSVRDLGVRRIISTSIEHHCGLHSLEAMAKEGVTVHLLDVDALGHIDFDKLEELLQDTSHKTLVTLMHANNEIGTIHDLARISSLCTTYGAFLHSDTVQTVGHYPIDVQALPITFLSGAGHKFHGPKGIGFIYINGNHPIKPYIDGGSQERNMRGGTENVSGIVGLAKALEMALAEMEARKEKILEVRNYLKINLLERYEDIRFNGDYDGSALYTVLNVSFPASEKSDLLLLLLDIAGVSVSGGSACTSGSEKGSHVLEGIKADPARKSIRFSFSHYNTCAEVDLVLQKLDEMVAQKKAMV
jgi:cysteine desulfurase